MTLCGHELSPYMVTTYYLIWSRPTSMTLYGNDVWPHVVTINVTTYDPWFSCWIEGQSIRWSISDWRRTSESGEPVLPTGESLRSFWPGKQLWHPPILHICAKWVFHDGIPYLDLTCSILDQMKTSERELTCTRLNIIYCMRVSAVEDSPVSVWAVVL